eukprot:SM000064S19773  [mRNA]  locus=s64:409862:411306:- [translate_table: standard]
MTTAARPTWAPAKGSDEQGGARIFGPSQKFSSRDLASHTKLKPRKEGQETREELKGRSLRDELEEKEHRHFAARDRERDRDRDHRVRPRHEERPAIKNIDADDSDPGPADESDDRSMANSGSLLLLLQSSDGDNDEDDTAELLAELERIKKERAEEKLRKERQQQEVDLRAKESELVRGNPLLNQPASFTVKRRWDDDVVFKNQSRGETKTPKRFINDTIRSDFHRKFLNKYIK